MTRLPPLVVKGKKIAVPIVQGGMGVGVSLHPLAGAVAREGGLGIVSSAAIDRVVSRRLGRKVDTYEAVREEVAAARSQGGFAGINIMVALQRDFADSVRGAIDAGADAIISGAGLPTSLPAVQDPRDTALIPIVSSARALEVICKKWEKLGYRPDAVVLEGPLAGGHLGFKFDEVDLPSNALEVLLPQVKDTARKHGDFPVIAAGGIFTHDDIVSFLRQGANGVQMGTRFLATCESSADDAYKRAVVNATREDIFVAQSPGSPCGLPFRVLRKSPMFVSALGGKRKPRCDKGYVLLKDAQGRFSRCLAKEDGDHYFCICNGLLSSAGYNPEDEEPLYTVGSNAYRVESVVPVKTLMDELRGAATASPVRDACRAANA
ncbi:MAG TPA: nitronate monooxygenase [Anaeromyxobacteraceae bacterium]|nr:nitronate monooxygenase [Anaeromyxobacteraceae bacterium]